MFDLGIYMTPYWQGDTVHYEAVLPLAEQDGSVADIRLLYRPVKLLGVYDSALERQFREGADYALVDGKLRILPGSEIPVMGYDTYYPPVENGCCKRRSTDDGYIFFSEGDRLHKMQIAVSYVHEDSFDGPIPPCKARLLPRLQQMRQRGETVRLCLYGDSISVGGNSSGFVEAAPYAPTWGQMVARRLGGEFSNPSMGGKTSQWGAENAVQAVGYGPDVCIIGFGMNDGTRRVSPAEFGQNIRTIMAAARAGNPRCEFVLVATSLPNGQVGRFLGCQEAYLPVLQAMEGPGVAVADMTTFHKYLLTKKRFFDMSGNNVNHPNDFLARAYAQVVWQTMVGY